MKSSISYVFVIACVKLGYEEGGTEEYYDTVKNLLEQKKATVLTVADGWGCSGWQLVSRIIYNQFLSVKSL